MISKKSLLEMLQNWKDRLGISPPEEAAKLMIKVFMDKVESMPEDAHDTNVGDKWIPVSERLPGANGVYSITRKINDGENIYYIPDSAYWDGTSTWHDDTKVNHSRPYLKNVIAWQPLPEPYKGE